MSLRQAAFAGELLGLRPIIHMVDDTTSTIAKVRGDSAVMPGLIVQTKKRMAEGTPYLIGATDDGNAKMLAKMCKKEFGYAPAGECPLPCGERPSPRTPAPMPWPSYTRVKNAAEPSFFPDEQASAPHKNIKGERPNGKSHPVYCDSLLQ